MQRRLCEMSEAKWSITEAKCLQMSHNKYASQRDAISPLYGNLMLSHSAGMQHPDISIAGISKRFHFASLHYIFSAYLPTHIKFLTEFHRIFFRTMCISFPKNIGRSCRGNQYCQYPTNDISTWFCRFSRPTFWSGEWLWVHRRGCMEWGVSSEVLQFPHRWNDRQSR